MKRIKKKEHELLTSSNLQKVSDLLYPAESSQAPITKKDACEMLNITYNTTRLNRILEDFQEKKEYTLKRKKENKSKPFSDQEIAEAVTEFLKGESVSEIAKGLYRSPSSIKTLLERIGVPSRPNGVEARQGIDFIPDECVSENFNPGEVVWSARHHQAVIIEREISVDYQAEKAGFKDVNYEEKYGSKLYAIYVLESVDQDKEFWIGGIDTGGYQAFALAYDLGKLTHLEKYGVRLDRLNI